MIRYRKNIHFYLLFLIFIFIYGPLYQVNSFGPGDDLVFLENFKSGNIFQLTKDFFYEKIHLLQRPLSTIFLVLIHLVFKEIFQLYLLSFFVIFLTTNFLIYKSLKSFVNKKVLKTFLLCSLTPFLTSSFIQSPYLLVEFILPIFFWANSLYFLTLSFKNKKNYFLLSNIFLFLSLFSTVIAFPLFVINLLLPFIFWRKNLHLKLLFTKIFIPIFFILLIYFGYLKFLNYFFNISAYGLSTLSLGSFFKSIYFIVTIFIEFPILISKSLFFSEISQLLIILLLVSLFFKFTNNQNSKEDNYLFDRADAKFFLLIIIISLFSNMMIFFISGYPSVTYGYYNRMLISAFITLSLIISTILNLNKNFYLLVLKIIIISLILNSSKVVSNQIIKIDKLKKNNIISLTNTLKNYSQRNKKNILVANLPLYLNDNFNNLEIFWLTWDLDQIIKRNKLNFYKSFPVSDYVLESKNYSPAHNFFNHLDILKKENIDNYIYYENKEVLVFNELEDILFFLETKKKRKKKLIIRENLRNKIKNYATNIL